MPKACTQRAINLLFPQHPGVRRIAAEPSDSDNTGTMIKGSLAVEPCRKLPPKNQTFEEAPRQRTYAMTDSGR